MPYNTFKDTDLREALRRIYSDMPQLPDDFAQRVCEAAERQRRRRKVRRLIVWPSMAAAACIAIAFILGSGVLRRGARENTVAMTKEINVPVNKPATSTAAGVSPRIQEVASDTQDLVNKKGRRKGSLSHRGEEPPAVEGANLKSQTSNLKPVMLASQEQTAEVPSAPDLEDYDIRHRVFRNRDEMRARIREEFADLSANNNIIEKA